MITRRAMAAALGTAAAVILTTAPANAAPEPDRPSARTIASGLDNPRGLAFGPAGELYVAEAGRGGPGPCRPGRGGELLCYGRSGAITAVIAGEQRRILRNLPSMALQSGAEAVGPSDVAAGTSGELYYTVAMTGLFRAGQTTGGGLENALGKAYEKRKRDLTALLVSGRDHLVVDAGAGALLRIGPRGRMFTVATFREPASVAKGPDGALYIAERHRIWRAEPGRTPRVHASGFTGIVDLTWSEAGDLYVLESSGSLIRISQQKVTVANGLTAPGGVAVRGRYAYVTVCGVCRGTGSVVRIDSGTAS